MFFYQDPSVLVEVTVTAAEALSSDDFEMINNDVGSADGAENDGKISSDRMSHDPLTIFIFFRSRWNDFCEYISST